MMSVGFCPAMSCACRKVSQLSPSASILIVTEGRTGVWLTIVGAAALPALSLTGLQLRDSSLVAWRYCADAKIGDSLSTDRRDQSRVILVIRFAKPCGRYVTMTVPGLSSVEKNRSLEVGKRQDGAL